MTPLEGFSQDDAPGMGMMEEEAAPVMTGAAPARVDYTVKRIVRDPVARRKLGARVREEFDRYESMTQNKRDLVRELRKDWEMLEAPDNGPWENSSRVRASHVRLGCDQHELRLNTLITGPERPFYVKARKPEAVSLLPELEDGLTGILEEADWKVQARETHKEIQIAPVLVRVTHERETRTVPRLNFNVVEEDLAELTALGAPVDLAMRASLERGRDGEAKVELAWEEVPIFDGVKIGVVPFEDLVVFPVSAPKSDSVWALGERVRVRGMDLLAGVKEKKYLRDPVKQLLLQPGDPLDEDDVEDAEDYAALDLDGGQYEDANYREYDCLELCWYDDLDRSGKMKWYILLVHVETETVLRCQYSPYEHGRPYYVLFNYISRSRQIFGQSTADLLATTQAGATAAINNFHDLTALLLSLAGSFFYDEDSEYDPRKHPYRPGMAIPARDPNNTIRPMLEQAASIPPAMEACLKVVEWYRQQADLLAAVSNPTMGVGADDTTTATEVQVVAGNADARFENLAAEVALQWKNVFDLVRWTAAQYAQAGTVRYQKAAAAGADPEWVEMSAEVLRADVDIVPTALKEWSNPSTQVARDQFVSGVIAADPVLAADLELKFVLLKQLVQDIRHPQGQQILNRVEFLYAQFMQQQQRLIEEGAKIAADGAAKEEEKAAKEEGRAQEQHELGMAQGNMGILTQANQLMQPPPMPAGNGNGKGKK